MKIIKPDSIELLECEGLGEMVGIIYEKPKPYNWNPRRVKHGLTENEWRVFELLAEGKTYAEIAETLVYAEKTVKGLASSILKKTGAKNMREAIYNEFVKRSRRKIGTRE